MKIAILGNSHVGALKAGWKTLAPLSSDISIDWFAAAGDKLAHLAPEGDRIVATQKATRDSFQTTSGGQDGLAPGDYDALVVVAFGLWPRLGKFSRPLSQAVHGAIYRNFAQQSGFFPIHQMIAPLARGKIFAACQPLRAAAEEVTERNPEAYLQAIADMQSRIFDEIGVVLIGQPPETVVNLEFTDPAYSRSSVGLLNNKAHPTEERQHMNADFGQVYLRRILDVVQGASVPA